MDRHTRIKICGIRTPDIAEAVVEAGADMIGVNFVEKSPRCVTLDEAAAVSATVAGRAEVVGLFKDGEANAMRDAVRHASLDRLQLHGWIDEPLIGELNPIELIPAVSYDQRIDQIIAEWDVVALDCAHVTALIIDTPDPSGIGGGTGTTYNWHALREAIDKVQPTLPIVLAGGLTPDNVTEAIETVRPWMVDVASGVESSRGVKDVGRIRAFCDAVRGAGPST